MKGYFMSYRDHNFKLNAIAWINNEQGVRIGSWKKEIFIVLKNKYETDYVPLDLLFDAIVYCNISNIEIVNFKWSFYKQLVSNKQSNNYLSKYRTAINDSMKKINSVIFKCEKVS